ncbi:hypothetical protein CL628_02505 [bacterium]|nr:hypothetical protein [bacterium]|tara:strand:- start:1211 stop:1804 length:594 start_codon:yes stop_codon:yes gene_type:complete
MTNEFDSHSLVIKRRYQRLALSILLLIILVGVQPLLWRLVKRQAELVHSRRTLEQQQADVQLRAEAMRGNLNQQRDNISTMDAVAPQFKSLPQAVERLELLAERRALSLEIQGISRLNVEDTTSIRPVSVVLRAFGPVESVLSFMEQIEHVQELTQVQSWQLEPSEAPPSVILEGAGTNYRLSAEIIFFLRAEDNGN